MSNEVTISQMNEAIARFMGFEKVRVGYFGCDDETEWQLKHAIWMEKMGMESVGDYFVNVKDDIWFELDNVAYHKEWSWLMPVVEKIQHLKEWRKDRKELRMFSTISVEMEFDGHYKESRCSIIGTITYCHNETIPHKYTEIPVPHIWINKKKTAIEATYLAVYQFITWYQSNKK